MGCGNKTEHNCGAITYALCTKYESEVSRNSSLEDDCKNIEETTQDIYIQLDAIDDKLNLTSLDNSCVAFTEPKTLLSVLSDLIDKVCTMQTLLEQQETLVTTLQTQIEELQANPCN